jgi:hypothetical protein
VLVAREGYHVITNVNLRVNKMAVRLEGNTRNMMEEEALIISVPSVENTDLTNIVHCAYATQRGDYSR